METTTQLPRLTREKAHAIINRLLTESMETRRKMEEEFDTDPGIQAIVSELKKSNAQKKAVQSTDGL